ncbi:MAG: hypothetical protein AAFN81_29215 [Bacteroidota bacterium]
MSSSKLQKCFVVMPFGQKPKNDGSDGLYDFDKVYRVMIQRAIRQAGMEPLRADETKGSRIIHTDMFKDLRDRPVVLVDMSLNNPNVFYELGIRHVMSASGTVLFCNKESRLPFDVNLSRTIFYEFDGQNLDWEEVERIIPLLQSSLEEARRGMTDSPVHSLLEGVLSPHTITSNTVADDQLEQIEEEKDRYQKMIADYWDSKAENSAELVEKHGYDIFGGRALGYLTLKKKYNRKDYLAAAERLYGLEQYDLANQFFEQIEERSKLNVDELLRYGSSVSEEVLNEAHASKGIDLVEQARQLVKREIREDKKNNDLRNKLASCNHELAGLLEWKWQLTQDSKVLAEAIKVRTEAVAMQDEIVKSKGEITMSLGKTALNILKLVMLLRVKADDAGRADRECFRKKILSLKGDRNTRKDHLSYLSWYQTITLADLGDADGSYQKALLNLNNDSKIMNKTGFTDIGRRQYTHLRRFLEQYSRYWANPAPIGKLSQLLKLTSHKH